MALLLLLLLLPSPSLLPTVPTTWVNSTAGVHTFLTFDSSWLATELKADPTDPRAKHVDFVWGADEWALAPIRAANPETRTAKYIPRCRDTQSPVFGAAAIAIYTQRGKMRRLNLELEIMQHTAGGANAPAGKKLEPSVFQRFPVVTLLKIVHHGI